MTRVLSPVAVALTGAGPSLPDAELGGKGAALDRLRRAGFPVPPTAAVTASAYRRVVAHPSLRPLLTGLRAGVPIAAEEVDRAFLAVPVPAAVAMAVVAAGLTVGGGHPVAVRSSATAEDLAAASFAGQYRSTLNVVGGEAILRAVRLTWASLWHPAPCAYRRAWGLAAGDIEMAVCIMRMVPARMAGVAFTVDPGGSGLVRVEAVPGLGEALVSGARTPRRWLLPRPPGAAGAVHAAPDRVPAYVAGAAAAALRVERLFGTPQDVEWAWDGNRLWLVQARPITVDTSRHGDGCDTPAGDSELTTAGIGEMLPGVLPPLWWDVNSFLVEEALRDILGRLGALPAGRHGTHEFVRRVAGRAALDLDLLKAAAAALPGASEAELERQYFGAAPTGSGPGPSTPRWRHLRHQARAAAVARGTAGEVPVVLDAVARLTADPAALTDLDDHDLLAYRRRLLDLGARAMTVELAVAAAAVAAYRRLELTIARHLGVAAGTAYAQRVTAGAGGAPRPQPGMSRAVFAGPTWAEGGAGAPPPGRAPAADPLTGRRALEHRLRTPKWRRTRLLTGQVVDVRIHALRRLITETAAGLDNRELVKAAVLALGGEVRRVHLEIGRRLAARGAIERVEDVDLLRDAGLAPALAGRVPPRAELDRRRRWVRRWRAEPPLPERFTGLPDRRPAPVPGGLDLRGLAASPGRHAGRARVVTDPIADRFDPDDVLVAVATDAGWSPLFLRAAAIVTERGGPLSHAAIVARELGVPAVLSVAGATAALAGRMVTVDGDAGTVTVHPDPERLP